MAEDVNAAVIASNRRDSRAYAAAFVITACLPLALVGAAVPLAIAGQPAAGLAVALIGAAGVAPQIVVSVKNAFNRDGKVTGRDDDAGAPAS
jgi:hypothetical protein